MIETRLFSCCFFRVQIRPNPELSKVLEVYVNVKYRILKLPHDGILLNTGPRVGSLREFAFLTLIWCDMAIHQVNYFIL